MNNLGEKLQKLEISSIAPLNMAISKFDKTRGQFASKNVQTKPWFTLMSGYYGHAADAACLGRHAGRGLRMEHGFSPRPKPGSGCRTTHANRCSPVLGACLNTAATLHLLSVGMRESISFPLLQNHFFHSRQLGWILYIKCQSLRELRLKSCFKFPSTSKVWPSVFQYYSDECKT